jgi:hypothetical protein
VVDLLWGERTLRVFFRFEEVLLMVVDLGRLGFFDSDFIELKLLIKVFLLLWS